MIKGGPGVFTMINTFTLDPTNQQRVIDLLIDITERFTRNLPGFVSATVHRGEDDRYVANYVQWSSKEHFQTMFQQPEMQAHMAELKRYVKEVLPIAYRIEYHQFQE